MCDFPVNSYKMAMLIIGRGNSSCFKLCSILTLIDHKVSLHYKKGFFFQAFVVFAFFVVAVIAKDDEVLPSRTRICKEGEFPGQRTRRQVADVMAPKPCWFIPNKKIATAEDCEETYKQTKTCEMSQVFVPLGQVCFKFSNNGK